MTDILLQNGDLSIRGGDLEVGLSDAQHIACILETHPAEWRQFPMLGVGIDRFLQDDIKVTEAKHLIAVHAEYDGAKLTQVIINEDQVNVKGYYGA